MFAFRPRNFAPLAYGSGDPTMAAISFPSSVTHPVTATHTGVRAGVKRAEDIVTALALLVVLAVPMLVVGIVIRLTSGGPALFHQERIGLHGRRFVMLKFR